MTSLPWADKSERLSVYLGYYTEKLSG